MSPYARRTAAAEVNFVAVCQGAGLPEPIVTEYRFAPPRRWRFDYAMVEHKVALEVEGGVWTGGRHTRGAGFLGDMAKYNEAARLGWRVFRVIPSELLTKGPDLLLEAVK